MEKSGIFGEQNRGGIFNEQNRGGIFDEQNRGRIFDEQNRKNDVDAVASTSMLTIPRFSAFHVDGGVDDGNFDSAAAARASGSVRVHARRYPLTYGGYKYMDIGIKLATPICAIEIAICDNRGNEVTFGLNDWKQFVDSRDVIFFYFNDSSQRERKRRMMGQAGRITLRLNYYKSEKVLEIVSTNPTVRMLMTYPTVRYMFEMLPCVSHAIRAMSENVDRVTEKFAAFRRIVLTCEADESGAPKVIRESLAYDLANPIDCEILVLFFVRNAIRRVKQRLSSPSDNSQSTTKKKKYVFV